MNVYVCFWEKNRNLVYGVDLEDAKQKATALFQSSTRKKVKPHDVCIVLAELDGEIVEHCPSSV
tara:strand:- start:513 stop:704 length:192 start_codon:yes stop_codon:yes gene_type:complete